MSGAVRVSIDGEVVPPERAMISVFDRGLLYGDGLFEVLRTWGGGVAVDLDAHLARLRASAAELQLRVPEELRSWVTRTLTVTGAGESRIRIVVTRGPGGLRERFAALGERGGGKAIVIVEPLPADSVAEVSLTVVELPPIGQGQGHGMKTLSYLDHVIASEVARSRGADDAVVLAADGSVAECATSNIFAVTAGAVATPPTSSGALPGIVRARTLAACARLGIPAAARRLTLDALRAADELFVTSSLRGVVPVTALEGVPRAAGPITARLAADHETEMSALAAASRDRALL